MTNWPFTVVLKQQDVDLDDADRIYSRCDDSTLITSGEVSYLEFDREAATLSAAITSAVSDIQACGFDVERVQIDHEDLASLARVS